MLSSVGVRRVFGIEWDVLDEVTDPDSACRARYGATYACSYLFDQRRARQAERALQEHGAGHATGAHVARVRTA